MALYDTLIRLDFVLAVGLLVVVPLGLLLASAMYAPVRDRLLVYWRASSLLGITVYLWAGEVATGFATGFAARVLIPLALWQGDALLVLRSRPVPTGSNWRTVAYRQWRTAVIAYSAIGLAYMLPLLPCLLDASGPTCQAWYEPPKQFTGAIHPSAEQSWLRRCGYIGLGIYAVYLLASAAHLLRDRTKRRAVD